MVSAGFYKLKWLMMRHIVCVFVLFEVVDEGTHLNGDEQKISFIYISKYTLCRKYGLSTHKVLSVTLAFKYTIFYKDADLMLIFISKLFSGCI